MSWVKDMLEEARKGLAWTLGALLAAGGGAALATWFFTGRLSPILERLAWVAAVLAALAFGIALVALRRSQAPREPQYLPARRTGQFPPPPTQPIVVPRRLDGSSLVRWAQSTAAAVHRIDRTPEGVGVFLQQYQAEVLTLLQAFRNRDITVPDHLMACVERPHEGLLREIATGLNRLAASVKLEALELA